MTHVKNVEAFTRMVAFCTGYGGKYNPGRPNLRIDALTAQLEAARQSLEQVNEAKAHFDNEVNYRKQVFAQVPKLATSVLRVLEASGSTAEKLEDVRKYVMDIHGRGYATPKTGDQSGEPIPVIRMQLAYVSLADLFSKLVAAVTTDPHYSANEPELSKEGLATKVIFLQQLNQRVIEARVRWSQARLKRNETLYSGEHSIKRIAQAMKRYLRAIFGLNSEEYMNVKHLTIEA